MNEVNNLPDLEFGMTGDAVKILQEKLKILDFYAASITGSFGKSTEVGVLAFQKENGLPETGVVDRAMWNLLFDQTVPGKNRFFDERQVRPTLRVGSTGDYVRELQNQLKQILYYDGNVTGTFDVNTENAVKRFQVNNKLTADGIVGRDTWSALTYLYSPLAICSGKEMMYTVKQGDTLYSVARRFDTTVSEIKRLNDLTSDLLSVGQQLMVSVAAPAPEPVSDYYVVKLGDTLYSIARNNNTTVDEIKRLNNLTSNILIIGQKLALPATKKVYNYHVVKPGDTLYSIARNNNTTVDEIKRLNNLTSNILTIGQRLLISV